MRALIEFLPFIVAVEFWQVIGTSVLVVLGGWVGLVYILPYGVHILGAVLASIGSILPARAGHEPKKSIVKIFRTQVTWDGRANSGLFIVGVCLILYSAVVAYRSPSPQPSKMSPYQNQRTDLYQYDGDYHDYANRRRHYIP
jgi:membrane protease YdiL (CAAX protease family)